MAKLPAPIVGDRESQLNFDAIQTRLDTLESAPAPGGSAGMPTIAATIVGLSPLAYWKLDELSGNFNATVGAINGPAGAATRGVKGPLGSRAAFTNANTFLATFGNNFGFAGNVPYTILLLLRPTAGTAGSGRRIATKEASAGGGGWKMQGAVEGTFVAVRLNGTTATNLVSDNFITGDEWNVLAIGYDGANQMNYLNGVLKTLADAVAMTSNTAVARLNGEVANTAGFNMPGRYSHFAIWDRALTLAELDSIHAFV